MKAILCVLLAVASTSAASAQEWARTKLERSPRHQEWIKVAHDGREVQSFITYPEVKDKATAVVVIHEIYGMSDWVRGVTDQLAEAGYIAIAPDLLSGAGPKGGGTDSMDPSAIGKAIRDLPPEQITADLDALVNYVAKLPACNGKVAVMGFCWGGSQAFRFATNNRKIKLAMPFYGTAPVEEQELARIHIPVLGFYGGNDNRVDSTIPKTEKQMTALGKTYEPVLYDGAGHGFMRAGESPPPDAATMKADGGDEKKARETYEKSMTSYAANKKARAEAWTRVLAALKKL